jgi:hypothetical protein
MRSEGDQESYPLDRGHDTASLAGQPQGRAAIEHSATHEFDAPSAAASE